MKLKNITWNTGAKQLLTKLKVAYDYLCRGVEIKEVPEARADDDYSEYPLNLGRMSRKQS